MARLNELSVDFITKWHGLDRPPGRPPEALSLEPLAEVANEVFRPSCFYGRPETLTVVLESLAEPQE